MMKILSTFIDQCPCGVEGHTVQEISAIVRPYIRVGCNGNRSYSISKYQALPGATKGGSDGNRNNTGRMVADKRT